jgi:hypothetical protein
MRVFVGGPTQISPAQIRLRELFSVARILGARGFVLSSEDSAKATLLEKEYWSYEDLNLMFDIFSDEAKRDDLLSAVENAIHVPETSDVKMLVGRAEFKRDRQRYSTTFEWFVGELLVRRFMAFSSSFGVTVRDVVRNSDGETSGDYDVLSVLGDMNLLYLECKTGKCHQSSILNSIERSISLHSVACIMFLGAGLSVAQLRQQLSGVNHPRFKHNGALARIAIKNVPTSEIFQWFDCYCLGAGETSGEVENKLRTVMRILAAHRSSVFEDIKPNPDEYSLMGYEYAQEPL